MTRPGPVGWAAVAAVVAAADGLALRTDGQTMSTAYRTAYQRHPLAIGAATAYLVAHLTGHLPKRYDPLRHIA